MSNGHALLSPSASSRWIPCPGSVLAEAQVKQENPEADSANEWSKLGTVAHRLLELCMRTGIEPDHWLDEYLIEEHPRVSEEMVNAVQVALDYVAEYVATYGRKKLRIRVEERVHIGEWIGVEDDHCNGTPDLTIEHLDGSMLVVIDYKHGMGKVHAKENTQTMLYAIGSARLSTKQKFKKYRMVIVQPRAGKRRSVDEWDISHSRLMNWAKNEVTPSARLALMKNAPRTAGSHCLWCKASARCRTNKRRALAVAQAEFEPLPDDPDPELIKIEEYPRILRDAEILENWIRAVRGEALKHLLHGGTIEGFKVGWGSRRREWDDMTGVIKWCKKHKLTEDDFSPRVLLSPAQLTKLVKKKVLPKRKRGDTEEQPNPLDAFITYSVPKPRVLPVEAPDEFEAIDEEE